MTLDNQPLTASRLLLPAGIPYALDTFVIEILVMAKA
jgi:hypothetical protein